MEWAAEARSDRRPGPRRYQEELERAAAIEPATFGLESRMSLRKNSWLDPKQTRPRQAAVGSRRPQLTAGAERRFRSDEAFRSRAVRGLLWRPLLQKKSMLQKKSVRLFPIVAVSTS
jgi:hypothetical protein